MKMMELIDEGSKKKGDSNLPNKNNVPQNIANNANNQNKNLIDINVKPSINPPQNNNINMKINPQLPQQQKPQTPLSNNQNVYNSNNNKAANIGVNNNKAISPAYNIGGNNNNMPGKNNANPGIGQQNAQNAQNAQNRRPVSAIKPTDNKRPQYNNVSPIRVPGTPLGQKNGDPRQNNNIIQKPNQIDINKINNNQNNAINRPSSALPNNNNKNINNNVNDYLKRANNPSSNANPIGNYNSNKPNEPNRNILNRPESGKSNNARTPIKDNNNNANKIRQINNNPSDNIRRNVSPIRSPNVLGGNYQSNNPNPYSGRGIDKSPVNVRAKPNIGLNNSPKQINSNRPQSGNQYNSNNPQIRPSSGARDNRQQVPSSKGNAPSSNQQNPNAGILQNRNRVVIEKVDYKINRNNPNPSNPSNRPVSGRPQSGAQGGIIRNNAVPPSKNGVGGRVPSNNVVGRSNNPRK